MVLSGHWVTWKQKSKRPEEIYHICGKGEQRGNGQENPRRGFGQLHATPGLRLRRFRDEHAIMRYPTRAYQSDQPSSKCPAALPPAIIRFKTKSKDGQLLT
jgi:hypothetical protein